MHDAEQQAVYDEIVSGPRARAVGSSAIRAGDGALAGPFNAMLVAPRVGLHLQRLGSAIRYRTSLPDTARELAILLCARAERSEFEWYAHAPIARAAGVPDEALTAILATGVATMDDGVDDDGVDDMVVAVTRSILDSGDVADDLYTDAVAVLGEVQLVELVTLVGYYRLLSSLLRVFRVGLPEDAHETFTDREEPEGETA
jgi:alkylhydroperoxidase family enzyme